MKKNVRRESKSEEPYPVGMRCVFVVGDYMRGSIL